MKIVSYKENIRLIVIFVLMGLFGSGCEWRFDEENSMSNAASHQADGDHSTAIIELKKILKHNASNKQARLMLAKSYLDTGQSALVEKELNYAKKLGVPMKDMAALWGQSLLLQKKYKRIFQDVPLTLVTLPEEKAKLMLIHGYAYAALREKAMARELFQKIKEGGLSTVDANIALSRLAMSDKNPELALKLIDEVIAAENNNTSAWLQKGQILSAQQDMDNASEAFKKVIEHSSKSRVLMQEFQARVFLTQIALTQKKLELARKNVDLLIKAVPTHPLSLYLSALVDYQEKKYDSAKNSLEMVIAQKPDDLRSKFLLGAIHYAKGSYEQANKYLSYFVENVPTHLHARKLLGAVRLKLGQPQGALDALMPIGETSEDSALLSMIGRAAILNNNPQQAEEFYKRATASNPTNQLLKKELANLYLSRGSIDEAIKELQDISGKDSQHAKQMLVYAHLRKQDFIMARKQITQIFNSGEATSKDYSLAGIVELAAGERLMARKYFEKALKLDSKHLPGLLSLARMDFEDGNLTSAKDGFTQVLKIDDKNVNAMMGLSALAGRENNADDALKWLLQAKEKNPQAMAPRIVLSRFYLKSGQPDRAIALLNESTNSEKNKITVMPLLISAQLNAGRKKQALSSAKEFLNMSPKSPIAHLHMARVKNALGDMQEAENALEKALRIKPDFLQARLAMASLKIKQGQYDSALLMTKQIKAKFPKQAAGLMLEGDIYLHQKQFTKAVKIFSEAYKKNPALEIVRKLSLAYRGAGKNDDAVRVLEQWVLAHPNDTSIRLDLALNYDKEKQPKKARLQYLAILEQFPDHIAALNNISLSYVGMDNSKALQYAEKAYKLKPDSVYIADTLAWVLLTNGDTERSISILSDVTKKSDNPSIHYHYAVGLNKIGSEAKAKVVLKPILDSAVDFPERELAMQLFGTLPH